MPTERPSIYPYQMVFRLGGSRRTVRGVIAEVEIEPWGGSIVPHERTLGGAIEDRLRLLRSVQANLSPVFAVFEGTDRLQHLHYQYLVECSEWYSRPEAASYRERAWAYFVELDGAIADLVAWTGDQGNVLVVSDHGAGPWEKTLNVNLLLHGWGYLRLPAVSRIAQTGLVAGPIQAVARRLLPRGVLLKAKSRINRGLDWATTRAFASQVAEQGIHINERGALPHGTLDREQAAVLEVEITERLMGLEDPADGWPIVDRVIPRAEVAHGPFAERAPHLFPLCRDQRYELSDTLAATSVLTDHRDRPWGYHHQDGVFIGAGPSFRPGPLPGPLDIVDVLPTAFRVAGLAVPEGLDGRVAEEAVTRTDADARGALEEAAAGHAEPGLYPFSEQDERLIEESLRGLGYLE